MISTLEKISKEIERQKSQDKKVGLITGCFDVLHFGHIQFFRLAKGHVDFLVVALDSDRTIFLSKGENRPINSIKHRLEVVSELRSVDAVFEITEVVDFRNSSEADFIYRKILQSIKPDYLITNISADDYWKEKENRAKHLQIKFLPLEIERPTSSTEIINKQKMDSTSHNTGYTEN